jgi:hypothetical protein
MAVAKLLKIELGHIYMKMSQENSLYSYLKQTKMSFFLNQRTGGQNRSYLRDWYQ